ncbi:GNAT family N-acetyltransferase [Kribbella sp. CA-293567]|uniref:GNAT family N-acetyltransferase n=1 Tax=Kribbella sp. CA-293567 TaxID=3002436 RepID=UPI0022DD971C|nr:GNAT family N-acetyltransferase [Kribbella sp. CA-293567]WBQ03114.1 GNAT family N-acetyltransferase [Kribbella sp. CA-293567]
MDITRLSPDDAAGCADAVALLNATHAVDCPAALLSTPFGYAAHLRYGWDGDPGRSFLARDENCTAVGLLEFFAPTRDNLNLAWIEVEVHPEHRGRGIGSELVRYAEQLAGELGRTSFGIGAWDLPKADAFVKRHGFEQKAVEVNRRQDLTNLDWTTVQKLYDEAVLASADYEVVRIVGELPDDLLDGMVAVTASINDAPKDDLAIEDEIFTPERLRAYEASRRGHEQTVYRVIARHRTTGEPAGHSVVTVERERPHIAEQHDTAVSRDHRGHRLGALVKTAMLLWLREAEPAVTQLDTWNAESNNHMIGINEQLGYFIVARTIDYQKTL